MIFKWYKKWQCKRRIMRKLYEMYTVIDGIVMQLTEDEKKQLGLLKEDKPKYAALELLLKQMRLDYMKRTYETDSKAEMLGLKWASAVPIGLMLKIEELHNTYILTPLQNAESQSGQKQKGNW